MCLESYFSWVRAKWGIGYVRHKGVGCPSVPAIAWLVVWKHIIIYIYQLRNIKHITICFVNATVNIQHLQKTNAVLSSTAICFMPDGASIWVTLEITSCDIMAWVCFSNNILIELMQYIRWWSSIYSNTFNIYIYIYMPYH